MDSDQKTAAPQPSLWERHQDITFCWMEMLDRAFAGLGPADQTLECVIDHAGRSR